MGVEIQTYIYQPMPLSISHLQTEILAASKPAPNIYNCLVRNCDGGWESLSTMESYWGLYT